MLPTLLRQKLTESMSADQLVVRLGKVDLSFVSLEYDYSEGLGDAVRTR